MDDIKAWLNSNKDYASGVKLYLKYGANIFLKNVLQQRESEHNREKLSEELCKIIEKKVEIPITEEPKVESELTLPSLSKPFNHYPEAIKELIKTAVNSWNSLSKLHRELRLNKRILAGIPEVRWDYLTKEERCSNALSILKLAEENRQAWQLINLYEQSGCLPEGNINTLPETAAELILLRNNTRSNVTKWRNKLTSAADEHRKSECKQILSQYEVLLSQVLEKIEITNNL